jgi:hypothetical protein
VLTKRFNARESREDDVARIKELEAVAAQQQRDVVYYKEAMDKIKVRPTTSHSHIIAAR